MEAVESTRLRFGGLRHTVSRLVLVDGGPWCVDVEACLLVLCCIVRTGEACAAGREEMGKYRPRASSQYIPGRSRGMAAKMQQLRYHWFRSNTESFDSLAKGLGSLARRGWWQSRVIMRLRSVTSLWGAPDFKRLSYLLILSSYWSAATSFLQNSLLSSSSSTQLHHIKSDTGVSQGLPSTNPTALAH